MIDLKTELESRQWQWPLTLRTWPLQGVNVTLSRSRRHSFPFFFFGQSSNIQTNKYFHVGTLRILNFFINLIESSPFNSSNFISFLKKIQNKEKLINSIQNNNLLIQNKIFNWFNSSSLIQLKLFQVSTFSPLFDCILIELNGMKKIN